jgi:hypothetical protein
MCLSVHAGDVRRPHAQNSVDVGNGASAGAAQFEWWRRLKAARRQLAVNFVPSHAEIRAGLMTRPDDES